MTIMKSRHEVNTKKIKLSFGELRIGRAADNDVFITDSTVSSHHARIFTYLNSSYIEDLQSSNGTFLNGKRVEKHILRPGDKLRLGSYSLEIDSD